MFVITIQWSQLPTKIMLMKQVETFSAVCSRLDSVKLDMFQALGLLVSTTPRSKRGKKNLLIICLYFILWFYNVCPPVWNIKTIMTQKNDRILFKGCMRATRAGSCRGFCFVERKHEYLSASSSWDSWKCIKPLSRLHALPLVLCSFLLSDFTCHCSLLWDLQHFVSLGFASSFSSLTFSYYCCAFKEYNIFHLQATMLPKPPFHLRNIAKANLYCYSVIWNF